MKVLVLGATGSIGLPTAQALIRAGHLVYGTTRSPAKAVQLQAEEITPTVAETAEITTWTPLIAELDVIIDLTRGEGPVTAFSSFLLNSITEAAERLRPSGAPKLTYIFTSGTWLHGENRNTIVTDTTPITKPIPISVWKPEHEQRVVHSTVLNGIVVRPGLVYGRSGSVLGAALERAAEGKVRWFGTSGGRYALVHCDDMADRYVRAAEKAVVSGGLILDGVNEFTESVDDFLQRLVEVSGATGSYEYIEPTNAFEAAFTTTTLIRPYLARTILGWQPRKPGLVDGLETYYAAWRAAKGM